VGGKGSGKRCAPLSCVGRGGKGGGERGGGGDEGGGWPLIMIKKKEIKEKKKRRVVDHESKAPKVKTKRKKGVHPLPTKKRKGHRKRERGGSCFDMRARGKEERSGLEKREKGGEDRKGGGERVGSKVTESRGREEGGGQLLEMAKGKRRGLRPSSCLPKQEDRVRYFAPKTKKRGRAFCAVQKKGEEGGGSHR